MGVWGVCGAIVGAKGSPHWIFDSVPGGTESLWMLHVRSLGFLVVLPLWVLIWGGGMLFKQPAPLGIRVPRGVVFLGMLDPT